MGNCLACFKEAPEAPLKGSTTHSVKEDMPEIHLFPAPSHVAASIPSLAVDPSPPGNGNRQSAPSEGSQTSACRSLMTARRTAPKSAPTLGGSESKVSEARLNALFEVYRDDSEDCILAEGIEQLCKDLQVSPEDFKVLVLAWKLNAGQMCRFTRTEFAGGLKTMRADTLKSIQARLPEIVGELERDDEQFKELYRFTFRFGLDSVSGQRILPVDMATILWRLVFAIRAPPILDRWLAFLDTHQMIRGIPKDTWNMFLNFSEHVGTDLSCYDDSEAWPSLFDDFVEFENDQANQNITKEKEKDELLITNE